MAAVAGRVPGAYLVDVARAYLQVGDVRGAARALVDAALPARSSTRTASRRLRSGVGLWRVP
ncbi:hypothetical protein ABTW72_27380 [Micromonospora sp. NPDC127501]|uniref:hypothetical protein n=1 Tax=Micromonospora sp. NPDC127501 TaxID=3154872 RepID=UPI00332F7686